MDFFCFIGKEQWWAFESINHCEKRLPLKLHSFWERGVSHSNNDSLMKPFIFSFWKRTKLCNKVVFPFIILLQLLWRIELQFVQVCYFVHMFGYTKWEYWFLTNTKGVHCLKLGPGYQGVRGKQFSPDWNIWTHLSPLSSLFRQWPLL